jgi:hypothetical protein
VLEYSTSRLLAQNIDANTEGAIEAVKRLQQKIHETEFLAREAFLHLQAQAQGPPGMSANVIKERSELRVAATDQGTEFVKVRERKDGGQGGGEGGEGGLDEVAAWRILLDSEIMDKSKAEEMRVREQKRFRDVRAAMRSENEEEERLTSAAAEKACKGEPAHTNEDLTLRKTIASLAGERVNGTWKIHIKEQVTQSSDHHAIVVSVGLSASLIRDSSPATPLGMKASAEGARGGKVRLPRVAELVHAKRLPPEGDRRRENLQGPNVMFFARTDLPSGRKATQKSSHTLENHQRVYVAGGLGGKEEVNIDDLLGSATTYNPDASAPAQSAVAMAGERYKKMEEVKDAVPVYSQRQRSSKQGGPKFKKMSKSRYNGEYLRNYRTAKGIPPEQIEVLEKLDAEIYGLKSPSASRVATPDSAAPVAKYLMLQELMTGTLKMFCKWRLEVQNAQRERRRQRKERVPRGQGGSFLPPEGLRCDDLLNPSLLLWAKTMGLRPHVELPRRKDGGGKTVAVCQRCARVYAKLHMYRESLADSLLSKARQSCAQLQVSGFRGGGGGRSVQESDMQQLGEEERAKLQFQRGLLHHARHLMPDSVGRHNVLQHASLAAQDLRQKLHVSHFFASGAEPDWGESILKERSASVDLGSLSLMSSWNFNCNRARKQSASVSREEWLLQNNFCSPSGRNWQSDVSGRYHTLDQSSAVKSVAGGGLANARNSSGLGPAGARAVSAWPPGAGVSSPWTTKWQQGVTPSVLPVQPHHTSRPQSRT